MRYLGMDVGQKTIGLATGEILAAELSTIRAPKNVSFYSAAGLDWVCQELKKIVATEEVEAIVIGLPVSESGAPTEESVKIKKFSTQLQSKLQLPIEYVDETLSSFMAEELLESQGADQKEIDTRVHQLSAELILQQFLEEATNGEVN